MSSIFAHEKGPRWPRRQKFRLSIIGTEAEGRYQAAVKSSQDLGGRSAFDQAMAAWAMPLGIRPDDGIYLAELRISSIQTLTELVERFVSCGTTKTEVKSALDRLIGAKLVEPVAPFA